MESDDSADLTNISFDATRSPSYSPDLEEAESDQFSLASHILNDNRNLDEEELSLDGLDDALSVHSSTPASTTTEELLPRPARRVLPPRRAAAGGLSPVRRVLPPRRAAAGGLRSRQRDFSHSPLQRRHALRRISSDSGTSRGTTLRSSSSRQVTPSSTASSQHRYFLRSSSAVSTTSSTTTANNAETQTTTATQRRLVQQRAGRGRTTQARRQVIPGGQAARNCRAQAAAAVPATNASQTVMPNVRVMVGQWPRRLSSSSERSNNQSPVRGSRTRRRLPLRRNTAIRRSRGHTPYSLHSNSPTSVVDRLSNRRNAGGNPRISSSDDQLDNQGVTTRAETETSGTFSNEDAANDEQIGVVYECITLSATQQVIPRRISVEVLEESAVNRRNSAYSGLRPRAGNAFPRYIGRRIVSPTSGQEDNVDEIADGEVTVLNESAPRRRTLHNSTIRISPDSSHSGSEVDNEVRVILTRENNPPPRSTASPARLNVNNPRRRGRGWVQVAYVAGGAVEETPAQLQILVDEHPDREGRRLRQLTASRRRQRQIEEDRLIAERFAREAARSSTQDCMLVEAINGPLSKKRRRISEENRPGTSGVNEGVGVAGSCTICMEDEALKPVGCLYCRQLIGCEKCVRKWFRTNNISHLNRYSPLSMGSSNLNHRSCPLCRVEWESAPEIAPFPLV